ncbi:hypothetical protein SAMD00019534_015950 [Acytostelium subglobosum LB1]|uniref:hypothetical protein n=1 Tax=Acytostelium subglobosum LB1 TaxID=1410327 RepID=UPI000644C258|nr:hypothetical protein SAMD00019534_015950 [Acytostelium subglobosum LB1]GAM18420.1 hypothetical protein SAMD00019534_015950 [Acytostelium subglobosum LB1]|eukprot:XP_012757640.1 hypothetical protein SAMD00019534_015950 [Acytostelium subglobosum LB1]
MRYPLYSLTFNSKEYISDLDHLSHFLEVSNFHYTEPKCFKPIVDYGIIRNFFINNRAQSFKVFLNIQDIEDLVSIFPDSHSWSTPISSLTIQLNDIGKVIKAQLDGRFAKQLSTLTNLLKQSHIFPKLTYISIYIKDINHEGFTIPITIHD